MNRRFILNFSSKNTNNSIIYNLIKKHDIKINIIKANISAEEEGTALVEMDAPENKLNDALKYLKENNVGYQSVDKNVHLNSEKCIHCGACTSVCFAGALIMDKENKLIFDTEKCIVCELCVDACPLGLFEIHFSE